MIEKLYDVFVLVCDCCGGEVAEADTFQEAVVQKRELGWKSQKNGGEWRDVCPECLTDTT